MLQDGRLLVSASKICFELSWLGPQYSRQSLPERIATLMNNEAGGSCVLQLGLSGKVDMNCLDV